MRYKCPKCKQKIAWLTFRKNPYTQRTQKRKQCNCGYIGKWH